MGVALDRLIECSRFHAVKRSQISVEENSFAAQEEDSLPDHCHRNNLLAHPRHHVNRRVIWTTALLKMLKAN
jgi:hypothetical protein